MLTSQDLIAAGIKPGELFGRILKGCQTIDEALAVWEEHLTQKSRNTIAGKKIIPGSCWHWLINCIAFHGLSSREFPGTIASNSEKRRWLESGGIRINNCFPKPDDMVNFPIFDLVLFPNSKNRITML